MPLTPGDLLTHVKHHLSFFGSDSAEYLCSSLVSLSSPFDQDPRYTYGDIGLRAGNRLPLQASMQNLLFLIS